MLVTVHDARSCGFRKVKLCIARGGGICVFGTILVAPAVKMSKVESSDGGG